MSVDCEFVDTSHSTGRISFGPGLLASQDPAQILLQRFEKGVFSQRTSGVLVSANDLQILLADHPCEEAAAVGSQLKQRANFDQCIVCATQVRRCAAPPILAR